MFVSRFLPHYLKPLVGVWEMDNAFIVPRRGKPVVCTPSIMYNPFARRTGEHSPTAAKCLFTFFHSIPHGYLSSFTHLLIVSVAKLKNI